MKQIDVSTRTHPNKVALVDDDDYVYLTQWRWYAIKIKTIYYAVRNTVHPKDSSKQTPVLMHRAVLNVPQDKQTDHINHNGLDNRRSNLRVCSGDENRYNQLPLPGRASKYKGVTRHGNNWRARIKHNKTEMHLGCYKSEREAAKSYDAKAKELFGEFAWCNF